MKPNTLTKLDCVRRARNLNQQAVAYRTGGRRDLAARMVVQRIRYMQAARLFA